jgi:hypothetical protein
VLDALDTQHKEAVDMHSESLSNLNINIPISKEGLKTEVQSLHGRNGGHYRTSK